jgi:hypothetical protein
MKRRGISRDDVKALIARGQRSPSRAGAFEARGYLRRQEAAVIFAENATRILVITVEWIGKD